MGDICQLTREISRTPKIIALHIIQIFNTTLTGIVLICFLRTKQSKRLYNIVSINLKVISNSYITII